MMLTCFTNPVNITVEFSFQLLLTAKLKKGLTIFHSFSFFGKFSGRVKSNEYKNPFQRYDLAIMLPKSCTFKVHFLKD